MHIYIEISQKHKEIPCVATLASNKQKMSLFSSTKSENRRWEQILPRVELVPVGRERWPWQGKGVGGWIRCKKMNTHICKCKNYTCWNHSRDEEGSKGEGWRRWIQVWYIWYIVRTFVNAIMYPCPEQQ
jgi:hypothetical protein